MKNKFLTLLLIVVLGVGVIGCSSKSDEIKENSGEPKTETADENQTQTAAPDTFSEEEMLSASRNLIDIWYKRLGAEKKEELEPVYNIFRTPETYKGAIEVFFDKGVAGAFKDVKVEAQKEQTGIVNETSFYYQAEVSVSSTNKKTGKTESFKESITMLVEKNDKGEYKIQVINGNGIQ